MSQTDWKNHPLVIASVAVTATIAIVILVYKEVLLPTHTLSLKNEILTLENNISELRYENSELKISNNEVERLQTVKLFLQSRLQELEASNLFSFGNPYPVGLSQVRVGDPIDRVNEEFLIDKYPDVVISVREGGGYLTVKKAHSVFDEITYYYDSIEGEEVITHVLFKLSLMSDLSGEVFQRLFVTNFGKPDYNPREGYYAWMPDSEVHIFKHSDFMFTLMKSGYIPSFWPDIY